MIEVEIKLKINDIEELKKNLGIYRFLWNGAEREEDVYFDNAEGKIRKSGQAFRVRTITDHVRNKKTTVMTHKGQKLDLLTMTRRELETTVGDGDVAIEMIKALGYQPVKPSVIKERENYKRDHITASIDRVEGLGDFLELEILIPDYDSKDEALDILADLLQQLGYSMKDSLQTSYLSMLQKQK